MKVICAGYSKTGTKSLNAALTKLGFNVYDVLEHGFYHIDYWIKIFSGKGNMEDFKKMYESVDAVVDIPAINYWYEILQAFPDAKIILTMRDEESWYKSVQNQMNELELLHNSVPCILARKLAPLSRKFFKDFFPYSVKEMSGADMKIGFLQVRYPCNEIKAKKNFRQHNAYVLQMAPRNKLLIFNVKDGWKPLCEFLNKDIPDEPFPHENIAGKGVVADSLKHPIGKQTFKEMHYALFILLLLMLLLFILFLRPYAFSTQAATFGCCIVGLVIIL